jgi:hypothetical protein
MAKRVLSKKRMTIPSAFLVRALARGGQAFHCRNCGERMFVRYESGLCPLCYNGKRALHLPEVSRAVPDGHALAGVLDDPAIEEFAAD